MALGEFQGKKLTYWGLDPRTCDSCRSAPATLFCRPDSAFLCATCNARVHSANKLASRHDRVPLCEVCEHAPAAVTCKADAAALCVTCDNDIHSANPLARRHDRVPIVPFYDLAAVNSDSHNLMISDDGLMFPSLKITGKEEEEVDYFFSDADPYLDLDYSDSVVPVQGKPALGPPPAAQLPAVADFSSYSTYSVCSSEVGVVPDAVGEGQVVSGGRATSGVAMDREARVMRYREKRKNRRFEKTIRYASRKAYAETRPRIKGRFVKRTKVEVEVEEEKMMMNSGMVMGIAVDGDYGLVPSF